MSSPYFPPPPHSTPLRYTLNRPRAPRQPVVNPYEKFTQAEFDHWISGITGTLRKVLGHEPDEPDISEHTDTAYPETSDDQEYESEGDGVNDSLADIRARYVTRLNKGKARDPMEGPGLSTWGKGDRDAPIEIDLDEDGSPDEDALDDEEVVQHLSFFQDSDEEEEEGEESPDEWQLPQSSLRTRIDLDVSDQEANEEEDESASSEGDERPGSDNVIELLSSDEEPREGQKITSEDEYESSEDEDVGRSADEGTENVGKVEEEDVDGFSPVPGSAHSDGEVVADDDDEKLEESQSTDEEDDIEEEDADEEEGSDVSEEEEFDEPHSDGDRSPGREIITVDSDEEEDQLDDEADATQPPDRDTAFPPHFGDTQTRIEIRDPWLGPRTYAEDYYSGGPVLPLPGTVLDAHHLGANDDTEFLTPGVITPAESNERESLPDEEPDGQVSHVPHLEFVHGLDDQAELPPEAAPVEEESSAEAVATYDVSMESEKDNHTTHSSPPPVEVDAKIVDVDTAIHDEVKQQAHPTIAPVSEVHVKVPEPSQNIVRDDAEAAREAEDEFDRAYEEMDAEVEQESHAEDPLEQNEQYDEQPHQLTVGLGISTVTVEEVTDEEASDKEASDKEEEEEGLSSSPVIMPLGTSDLDVNIESIFGDEQNELHSDDIFSPHMSEAEGQVAVPAEGAAGPEEPVEVLEIAENEQVELEQSLDLVEHEVLSSPLSEPSAGEASLVIGLEEIPDDTEISTPVFPPADFVNTAVEVEHEQQQLPTPPAEQEPLLQRSPIKHQSPEPEVLPEHDQLPMAEDVVDIEQTPATLSALSQEVSEAQAEPLLEEAADEIDSTKDIMQQASSEHEASPISAGFEEGAVHPTSIPDALNDDMGVQDVTEDLDVVPDDWPGIVDEIASNAPSEEPLPHDVQESASVYSKEGSIVSLAATDGFNASGSSSYNVEEVFDDEITDDDAYGEVDPDTSLNLIQDDSDSHQLTDLAGEIFKDDWWTPDTSRKPLFEADTTAHTVMMQDGENFVQEIAEEAEPLVTFSSQSGDEDDIASSREASLSPEALLQPTRSPSPTVDPKELMTRSLESVTSETPGDLPESEKELYQSAEANNQVQTRENTVESIASETLLPIGTMTTPPEEASPTIPGLMLTTPQRPASPIPGLGAHLSEDTVIEAGDSEIPGLTWSKMFSSSAHVSYGASSISGGPLRSPSFPEIVPSTPAKNISHDFSTTSSAFFMPHGAATEQGLFLDPYPYSLSTPGLDNVKDDGEDSEEDLEEQDMSMSSSSTTSTVEKEIVEAPSENDKEGDNTSEKLPTPEAQEIYESIDIGQADLDITQGEAQLAETDDAFASGDADQDRDADGDLDPDFLQFPESMTNEDKAVASMEEPLESTVTPENIESSPDLDIKDSVESVDLPDEAVEEQRSEPEGLSPNGNEQTESVCEADAQKSQESDVGRTPEFEGVPQVESIDTPQSAHQSTTPGELTPRARTTPLVTPESSPVTVTASSQDAVTVFPEKSMQNGKRKRSPSPQPQRKAEKSDQQVENGKSAWISGDENHDQSPSPKGAKRARVDHATNGKHHISYLTDQSSLSSEEEDDDFNAGSVMSLTDTASPKSQAAAVAVATEPFYPMLHRHGSGAKKQFYQRPSQKAQSTTRPLLPPQRASTSRTTRSNCRYRKISVPKEEDGPRVCFLVPGCSLGDEEVIEENEIEDLGEASYADSLRMIQDIESLDFDSYLIGVLRQLVGVDLLREQEVFYLPAPGEEPTRKPQLKKAGSDKSASGKKSSKSGNLETSSVLDTPRHSVKAPSSKAGSISTTASRPIKDRGSSTPPSSLHSDSSSDEGEESEDTERKPGKEARGKREKGKMLPTLAERSARGGKQVKRSRWLASEALAYRPISDSEDELSTDDDTSQPRYRIRTTSRGSVKRAHSRKTFAGSEGANERDAKRHKRDR